MLVENECMHVSAYRHSYSQCVCMHCQVLTATVTPNVYACIAKCLPPQLLPMCMHALPSAYRHSYSQCVCMHCQVLTATVTPNVYACIAKCLLPQLLPVYACKCLLPQLLPMCMHALPSAYCHSYS